MSDFDPFLDHFNTIFEERVLYFWRPLYVTCIGGRGQGAMRHALGPTKPYQAEAVRSRVLVLR
jgi:hypothetical protein